MDKNLSIIFEKYFKQNEKLIQEAGPALALIPLAWKGIKFYVSCAVFPEAVDTAAILTSKGLAKVGIGDGNYNPQWSTLYSYDPEGEDSKSADYYARPPYPGPGMMEQVGWLTSQFVTVAQGSMKGMTPQQYVDYLNKFWVYPSPNMLKKGITYTWSRADMIRDKFYHQWKDDVIEQGEQEYEKTGPRRSRPYDDPTGQTPLYPREDELVPMDDKTKLKIQKDAHKRAQRVWEYWIADPKGSRHPWIRFKYHNANIANGMFVIDPKGLAYTLVRRIMFDIFRGSASNPDSFGSKNKFSNGRTIEKRYVNSRLRSWDALYPSGPLSIYKEALGKGLKESEQRKIAERAVYLFQKKYPWVTWVPSNNMYQNEIIKPDLYTIYTNQIKSPKDNGLIQGKWAVKTKEQLEQEEISEFSLFPDETSSRTKNNLLHGKNLKKEFELLFKGADFSQQHGYNISPDKFDEQHVWSETVDEYWKLVEDRLGKLPTTLSNSLNPGSSIGDASKKNPSHRWMDAPSLTSKDHGILNFVYGSAADPNGKECEKNYRQKGGAPCSIIHFLLRLDKAIQQVEDGEEIFDPMEEVDSGVPAGIEAKRPDVAIEKFREKTKFRNRGDWVGHTYRLLVPSMVSAPEGFGDWTTKRSLPPDDYTKSSFGSFGPAGGVSKNPKNLIRNPRRQKYDPSVDPDRWKPGFDSPRTIKKRQARLAKQRKKEIERNQRRGRKRRKTTTQPYEYSPPPTKRNKVPRPPTWNKNVKEQTSNEKLTPAQLGARFLELFLEKDQKAIEKIVNKIMYTKLDEKWPSGEFILRPGQVQWLEEKKKELTPDKGEKITEKEIISLFAEIKKRARNLTTPLQNISKEVEMYTQIFPDPSLEPEGEEDNSDLVGEQRQNPWPENLRVKYGKGIPKLDPSKKKKKKKKESVGVLEIPDNVFSPKIWNKKQKDFFDAMVTDGTIKAEEMPKTYDKSLHLIVKLLLKKQFIKEKETKKPKYDTSDIAMGINRLNTQLGVEKDKPFLTSETWRAWKKSNYAKYSPPEKKAPMPAPLIAAATKTNKRKKSGTRLSPEQQEKFKKAKSDWNPAEIYKKNNQYPHDIEDLRARIEIAKKIGIFKGTVKESSAALIAIQQYILKEQDSNTKSGWNSFSEKDFLEVIALQKALKFKDDQIDGIYGIGTHRRLNTQIVRFFKKAATKALQTKRKFLVKLVVLECLSNSDEFIGQSSAETGVRFIKHGVVATKKGKASLKRLCKKFIKNELEDVKNLKDWGETAYEFEFEFDNLPNISHSWAYKVPWQPNAPLSDKVNNYYVMVSWEGGKGNLPVEISASEITDTRGRDMEVFASTKISTQDLKTACSQILKEAKDFADGDEAEDSKKAKGGTKNYPKLPEDSGLQDLGVGINNGLAIRIVKFKDFALMYRAEEDLSRMAKEIGFWNLKGEPVAYLWMGSIHRHPNAADGSFPEKTIRLEDEFKKSAAYKKALEMKLKMPKVHKDHEAEEASQTDNTAKVNNNQTTFPRAPHEIENGMSAEPFVLVHSGKTPGFETFPQLNPGKMFTYDYQVLSSKELTVIRFTTKNLFSSRNDILYSKVTGEPIGFINRDNTVHIHSPMNGFPQVDERGKRFIASLPTSSPKGREKDIRNQRPQIPADLPKVVPPPRLGSNDELGSKTTSATATTMKQVPSDFMKYKISKALIRKMNEGEKQNYSLRKLEIVQAKLIRDHGLPSLNKIQGNLIRYFEGGGKGSETFKGKLEEQKRKSTQILGDNDYGEETRDAIMAFQEALIARGFLNPQKSSEEFSGYTNKDGLYGPNTHKMWKKATQHGLYDEKNLEKLSEDRKNELKPRLIALSKQKGGDTKTRANVAWAKWMLSRLGVEQKVKKKEEKPEKSSKSDQNRRQVTKEEVKKLHKKVAIAKKQGKISDAKTPWQKCVPGCDIGWDLYIEIQHAANNLAIDTLEGRTVNPTDPCIPIKAYCDKMEAEKRKPLEIKPAGRLARWTRSKESVDTSLGFKVAKWSSPPEIGKKSVYIPTDKMNLKTIQKINPPVVPGKPWSANHLPIYDENGKGIGWLLGGKTPMFRKLGGKLPADAKFEKIQTKPAVKTENNRIFENYFRKNERR